MKLQINVPVSGLDLASILQDEEGLFLCQNRGQNYLTGARHGHSIAAGPTPIGKSVQDMTPATLSPEPWVVTKISDQFDSRSFQREYSTQESRSQR